MMELTCQFVGKWILYYDWACDNHGYWDSATITINADGTLIADEVTGLWVSDHHLLIFTFDGYETTYSGVIFPHQIKGIMGTFEYAESGQGCFRMVPLTMV